jgi:hypothetical protein
MGLLFDVYDTIAYQNAVGPSSINTMSDADYIVNVLGFENPNDYWMAQYACCKHRERLLIKAM